MIKLICIVAITFSPTLALASPILDGEFENPAHLFLSDYTDQAGPGCGSYSSVDGCWVGYGEYTLTSDPYAVHGLWSSFGDHTTGTGEMLVVNGGPDSDTPFWLAELGASLQPNVSYQFSFWAASVFPVNPATIRVTVDGQQIGSDMLLTTTVGQWSQFTASFSPLTSEPVIQMFDPSAEPFGNDFAIDDISLSLTDAPEPGTWMLVAGGMVLAAALWHRRCHNTIRM